MRERAPDLWSHFLTFKRSRQSEISSRAKEAFLCLGRPGEPVAAAAIGPSSRFPNVIHCLDLRSDPRTSSRRLPAESLCGRAERADGLAEEVENELLLRSCGRCAMHRRIFSREGTPATLLARRTRLQQQSGPGRASCSTAPRPASASTRRPPMSNASSTKAASGAIRTPISSRNSILRLGKKGLPCCANWQTRGCGGWAGGSCFSSARICWTAKPARLPPRRWHCGFWD